MKLFFKKLVISILTWESRLVLQRHKPSIVAVTGSVGKTATKDAIYAMLSEHARVRKSEKSYNSEIGIPLTILGRPNAWNNPIRWLQNIVDGLLVLAFRTYPNWLVLEVGADRPGDIRKIAAWLPIDIAVITHLPEVPAHIEYFDSVEAVVEEKASLIAGLKPSGTLILSADDERVLALQSRAPAARVITFGFAPHADVRAEQAHFISDESGAVHGMEAVVHAGEASTSLKIYGAVGEHIVLPALAAIAVGNTLNMKLPDMVMAIERHYSAPPGRMHLVAGTRGSLIIDDTYNSSPTAVSAALNTLNNIPVKGRKFAVLGDMMELGRYSTAEHRKVGVCAAECLKSRKKEPHVLMTVGIRARDSAQAALDAGMPEGAILQYEESGEAGAALAVMLKAGDTVLVKGSQSMRMERAVEMIMVEPERASELLVRQDGEWRMR